MNTTDKIIQYLGTPTNIIGSAVTAAMVTGTMFIGTAPFLPLLVGAASYAGTYLLVSPKKHIITMGGTPQEKETIHKNIALLETQIQEHSTALPVEITGKVENILTTLKDLLPRWEELNSFTEQKYTVNSIVADYLPTTLNNYLSLPKSYLVRTKKETEGKIVSQLNLLETTLNTIQDSVYAGVERKIEEQSLFLQDKFLVKENGLNLK